MVTAAILATDAFAQAPDSQSDDALALPFCQTFVKEILTNERDDVYRHFSARMRRHYSKDELLKSMDLTPTLFGEVTNPRLSQQGRGVFESAGELFDTMTCEFSVTPTKVSSGVFMRVHIDRTDFEHHLVAYQLFKRIPL